MSSCAGLGVSPWLSMCFTLNVVCSCSFVSWCWLVGARLVWHFMVFIFFLMSSCRSPARLTSYVVVHISLHVDLPEPGSFDILWCSYFSSCHLVGARLDWHLMFSILRGKAMKREERSKRRLQEFNRLKSDARLAIAKWVPTMLAHLKVSMWGFLNGGHW